MRRKDVKNERLGCGSLVEGLLVLCKTLDSVQYCKKEEKKRGGGGLRRRRYIIKG